MSPNQSSSAFGRTWQVAAQAASGHSGKHPIAMLLQERLHMLQAADGRLKACLAALQHYLQLIQAEQQYDAKLLAHEGKRTAAGGPREE